MKTKMKLSNSSGNEQQNEEKTGSADSRPPIEELFDERILKNLYNLAFRMTGHPHDAEDIVHDAIVQAYRSYPQFRGDSAFSTWLYVITKNKCLKYLQKRARTSFHTLENIIHTVGKEATADYEAVERTYYIEQVKEGCLSGLLRCLPLQQRIAFILQGFLEMNIGEIASVLEKTENAARILIHRAQQSLKDYLCRNCSLYDPANPCRCEYLVNFSLKNNWVTPYAEHPQPGLTDGSSLTTLAIEKSLKAFNKIARLYQNLPDHSPDSDFIRKIRHEIRHGDYPIFSSKKVK